MTTEQQEVTLESTGSQQDIQFEVVTQDIYIVFTVGIPGLGKSYLLEQIRKRAAKDSDVCIQICTSDQARSKVLDVAYKVDNIDVSVLTQEQIYKIESANSLQVRQELFAESEAKFMHLANSQKKTCIFVLDKNYCSSSLIEEINRLASNYFQNDRIHRCILVPETFEKGEEHHKLYPFKRATILIGLERSLNRKEHLTMKYGPVHSLLSFISCLKSQLKDPFNIKFPTNKYHRVVVNYYDREHYRLHVDEPQNKESLEKLRAVVLDLLDDKISVPDACPEVMKHVVDLAPLNKFANNNDDIIEGIYQSILAGN